MSDDKPAPEAGPKWNRRKDARPGEIIEAALELFVTNGFAATRLSEVAQRAGVAKGTLYRYFDTKEDLFRAVVRYLLADILIIAQSSSPANVTVDELLPELLLRVARKASGSRLPGIVRMVVAESRSFPDLARIWHGEVASPMLGVVAAIIAGGQARGEIRPGDPHLHALSIIGPMLAGLLYREVFGSLDDGWPDMEALARQHAATLLHGLRVTERTS